MEHKQNPESPGQGTGLFCKDGREIPPTHPDHGPMHLLPRQEDGGFAAFYYCSKAELYDAEVAAPPPRRDRRDGFDAERQARFIEEIRGGASGREAARRVGISPTTAYNRYNSADGAAFRAAWDEAARASDFVLEDTAYDRAVHGQEEIVYHKGEQVGVRVRYDNKLLMRLLRARLPLKYAPLSEIEGWLRHRGIAPPPGVDGALDRLRAAEAEWGRRLPGESPLPRIATETVRPEPVEGPDLPAEEKGKDRPSTDSGRTDQAESASPDFESASLQTARGDDGDVESTSSTSSANERPDDASAESASSASPPSCEPSFDDSLIFYPPPPRPGFLPASNGSGHPD